ERDRRARIGFERAEQRFAGDGDRANRADGVDVRYPPGTRVEHLDLADELARPDGRREPRPLDANRPFDDEQEVAALLADPHHGFAVRVRAFLAEGEDGVEQLTREEREDVRILDQALVAPAVEKERAALA